MADDERLGMNVLFHYDAGAALVQRLDALRADGMCSRRSARSTFVMLPR